MAGHEQISDLQARLVFQEQAIDDLNKTVSEQHNEITLLKDQLKQLYGQLQSLESLLGNDSVNDIELPPHY